MMRVRWPRIATGFLWCQATSAAVFVVLMASGKLSRVQVAGLGSTLFSWPCLRLDALSLPMFLMVSFLGAVVATYSVSYLRGDGRQGRFFRYLLLTTTAVSWFVLAPSLWLAFLTWLATSWGLHRLLLHVPSRPGAVLAARKKFVVSRIGDVAILTAILLVQERFGTTDYGKLFNSVGEASWPTLAGAVDIQWIGILFVIGAMTKSAQFPFHFWLPETMETPTPVSALMHAGIINAGGYLIIRLSPLLVHIDTARLMLVLAGALTAVLAALVMITQNDIKKKLAYSTISQMGLMMFECGVGAYVVALLHIFLHSGYKAHAFLSTGGLIDGAQGPKRGSSQLSGLATTFALVATGGVMTAAVLWSNRGLFPLLLCLGVTLLGLCQAILAGNGAGQGRMVWLGTLPLILATGAIYLLLEQVTGSAVQGVVAPMTAPPSQVVAASSGVLAYLIFGAGFLAARAVVEADSPCRQKLYLFCLKGGGWGPKTTAWLTRIWPLQRRALAVPSGDIKAKHLAGERYA